MALAAVVFCSVGKNIGKNVVSYYKKMPNCALVRVSAAHHLNKPAGVGALFMAGSFASLEKYTPFR
jgi:hypothetical protein